MGPYYAAPGTDYCASPMQFSNIPELAQSGYDETSTDSSPSPSMFYSSFDNVDCSLYPNPPDTAQYLEQQAILNSIEFTDLTAPQHEDRRRRKSTTMQDKQTITNMRIVCYLFETLKTLRRTRLTFGNSAAAPKTEPRNGPSASAKKSTSSISSVSWRPWKPNTKT
ncbi:MAG: hypothetical protein Q9214_005329 [Letrouitia sp. 1 TL-2023]